ncbi:MAG: extracellular solute-binding protein, partial [Betaproteobacteria bacterium]|nr:extracellular solute-binding protein [Betaproteobacteria bacterium]
MRKSLIKSVIGAAVLAFGLNAAAIDITGAGASFPYPIYAKWAEAYKAATGNSLNYQSIGSSGGIKQIRAKTVDFGATDDPISAADLDKDGMVQFPAIMGGVVAIYNLPGIENGKIRLTGSVLADMFMGWIVNW